MFLILSNAIFEVLYFLISHQIESGLLLHCASGQDVLPLLDLNQL